MMRSAAPSRRLSREVSRLVRLMKLRARRGRSAPGAPVDVVASRSKVRSIEPLAGSPKPAYSGLAPAAYNGSVWLVMPCRGRSAATTTKPASANESATPSMSVRLRVMPCSKMSAGQPLGGLTPPPAEFALGTVTNTGICSVAVGTGSGLKRVRKRLLGSSGDGLPCQYPVSGRRAAQVVRDAERADINVRVPEQAEPGGRRGGEPGADARSASAAARSPRSLSVSAVDCGGEAEGQHHVRRVEADALRDLQVRAGQLADAVQRRVGDARAGRPPRARS